jgi:hypothetical protein
MPNSLRRGLLFFVLPVLAVISYPPKFLLSAAPILIVGVVLFCALGVLLLQGRSLALTFAIFVQGINAIMRLMMFFPNSFGTDGTVNFVYLVTCLLGMGLSIWLLLRLDRQDIRLNMVR